MTSQYNSDWHQPTSELALESLEIMGVSNAIIDDLDDQLDHTSQAGAVIERGDRAMIGVKLVHNGSLGWAPGVYLYDGVTGNLTWHTRVRYAQHAMEQAR